MGFYKFARNILLKPFIALFLRAKFKGTENIPMDGKPLIICCNHVSYMDAPLLVVGSKRTIRFLSKQEAVDQPVLGFFLKKLGCIGIKRGTADKTAITRCFEALKGENMLGIFPEGTRSKTGELLKPKAGAAMIAYKGGANIIPCCIKINGKKMHIWSKVTIRFGEVIMHDDLGMQEGRGAELRDASRLIMSKISDLLEMGF